MVFWFTSQGVILVLHHWLIDFNLTPSVITCIGQLWVCGSIIPPDTEVYIIYGGRNDQSGDLIWYHMHIAREISMLRGTTISYSLNYAATSIMLATKVKKNPALIQGVLFLILGALSLILGALFLIPEA